MKTGVPGNKSLLLYFIVNTKILLGNPKGNSFVVGVVTIRHHEAPQCERESVLAVLQC